MEQLYAFGWNDEWALRWSKLNTEGLVPARVVADFGTSLKVARPAVVAAELSGKLAHYSNRQNIPKVGDWVAIRLSDNSSAVIETVVPRRSEIARKIAGKRTVKQVIAANVDTAFVVLALDDDFSVKRLERFLYQLTVNTISPVIVLNKADKADDVTVYTKQLAGFDLPLIISTAVTGGGVEEILGRIRPSETVILLGSSGVGKSTLTNRLLGREAQPTQKIRTSDSAGKHTTVHRELFVLPGGGLLIDTPGIRELQLWGTEEDLDGTFDDIAVLVRACRYVSCQHGNEPGCAIRQALHSGKLLAAHYDSYQKLKRELSGLQAKQDVHAKQHNKRSRKHLDSQTKDALREMDDEAYYEKT